MFAVLNSSRSLLVAVLLYALPLGAAEISPLTHQLTPLPPGQAAPTLRLPNLDDEITDLAQLHGQVVVVNFWATWCPPCRREMPSLERLHQLAGDKGVRVLAVDIGEDIDTVFPFIGQVDPSPTFPLLLDREGTSPAQWGVKGLPTTFILHPDGTLAYRAVGGREFDHPDIVRQLLDLLPQ